MGDITALVSVVMFFLVLLALVLTRGRSRPRALPRAPQGAASLEIERRRADMAEAEIRALRLANLQLHEELERVRRATAGPPAPG
jgi:hypothetical protein